MPEPTRKGMSFPIWHEEPIFKKHDRKSFHCGDPSVNDFMQRYARQSHESGAAVRRCLRAAAEVGGVALIIDAKNDRAARWCANYGAVPLSNKPPTLVMALATFAADLKAAGQLEPFVAVVGPPLSSLRRA